MPITRKIKAGKDYMATKDGRRMGRPKKNQALTMKDIADKAKLDNTEEVIEEGRDFRPDLSANEDESPLVIESSIQFDDLKKDDILKIVQETINEKLKTYESEKERIKQEKQAEKERQRQEKLAEKERAKQERIAKKQEEEKIKWEEERKKQYDYINNTIYERNKALLTNQLAMVKSHKGSIGTGLML
jgi:hypothetical protein